MAHDSTQLSIRAAGDGCYEAKRAAALSGVPLTTIYWWARSEVVVPSVSPTREKLWSYADLMALRIVSWLRHVKPDAIPASPMSSVRAALRLLGDLDLDIWSDDRQSPLIVDPSGQVYVVHGGDALDAHGNPTLLGPDVWALTAPFDSAGLAGPDLVRPRPHLRIVPSKVAGEPHVARSRITTSSLAALADRGYPAAEIASLYDVPVEVIEEAVDLERQLHSSPVAA